jgi:hypothetical protein
VAAKKGIEGCVVIVNTTENDIPLELSINAEPSTCYITSNGENEKKTELPAVLPKESIFVVNAEIR